MPSELNIEELAAQAGVSVRTVRYYITQGLLPGPGARGKAASYSEEHLLRLQLIRRLVEQHLPLADVRERLEQLSAAEVRKVLKTEERRGGALKRASESGSPREYLEALLANSLAAHREAIGKTTVSGGKGVPSSRAAATPSPSSDRRSETGTWRRLELAPGVELHIRSDAEVREAGLLARLRRAAAGDVDTR